MLKSAVLTLSDDLLPTGTWVQTLLYALARAEIAGLRNPRITEPHLNTWQRFRGRLTLIDFVEMLFEDAAVIHPIPFDKATLRENFNVTRLPDPWIEQVIQEITKKSSADEPGNYLIEQAKALNIPTRLARSDLHTVKVHHKVLELPGTGGQLAHYLVQNGQGLTLQDNFVVACTSWQEQTLAGIAALDLRAPRSDFAMRVDLAELKDPNSTLRQRSFDYVIGLHPDKGGLFRVEEQLALWFPNSKILFV